MEVLEEMFSGVGGEILFTPFASSLAYSAQVFIMLKKGIMIDL